MDAKVTRKTQFLLQITSVLHEPKTTKLKKDPTSFSDTSEKRHYKERHKHLKSQYLKIIVVENYFTSHRLV
jgi:hypothetical protein